MGTKGESTRERILAVAEARILQNGFSGTSIDEVIEASGITKGGFFYHFDGKQDLARHLLLRYLEQDREFFGRLFARAEALSEDPLQQFLIFVNLLAEEMENLPEKHPGCLVASFTYESRQFDPEIEALNRQGVLSWRAMFAERLQAAADHYAMNVEISMEDLADMLSSIIEGGIIVSRVVDDRHILVNQIRQYRSYIRLLFGDVRSVNDGSRVGDKNQVTPAARMS